MATLARRRRGAGRAGVVDGRRLLGLRLPQGARRRLRAAGLPVDVAARALRAGVPVLAARRAADGLLPARLAGPRGAAARASRCCAPDVNASEVGCTVVDAPAEVVPLRPRKGPAVLRGTGVEPTPLPVPTGGDRATVRSAVRLGLGYVLGVRADEVAALVAARAAGGPVPDAGGPRRPRGRRGARRWRSSPGRARATRWPANRRDALVAPGRRRAAAPAAGRDAARAPARACPRRPRCARSTTGGR